MEVVDDEPLRRRIEQVDEREAEPGPTRRRGACARAGRRAPRRARRRSPATTRSRSGLGQSHHSGARSADDRVEVGAEPRDLLALEVGHLEEPAVRRRPDGLGEVPDVEAARLERPLLEHRERGHPGGERADREPEQRARPGHAAAIARSSNAAPASTERRLARRAPRMSRGRRRRSARASARSPASRRTAAARAAGSPGGTSSASRPSVSSSRAAGVSAVIERRRAGDRLEGLVGNHARGLGARAEDAERAAGGLDLVRQIVVLDPRHPLDVPGPVVEEMLELAAADDAERDLGRERGGGEDRLEPVERDQLADEEGVKRALGLPARTEEPVLGADEAHLDASAARPNSSRKNSAWASVSATTRSARRNARRSTMCTTPAPVDPRRNRWRSSTIVSNSETSGLKITGRPRATRFAAGRSKWPGIADDQRVGVALVVAASGAGCARPRRPAASGAARPTSCGDAPRRRGAARCTSTPAPRSAEITWAFRG